MVQGASSAYEAIERLRAIYCATSGHDFAHVFVPDERVWLRESVEARRFRPPVDPIEGRELLDRVTQIEVFERFLHRTFPGKTRFSIEGLDLMVPILDEIIADAAASGVKHVLIAMAHRGRLNVLAHVMQKPYAQILAEFKDPLFARSGRIELGWMGDVKYHAGARLVRADVPSSLVISMPPNPSHLEAVDPVLVGMARASATRVDAPGAPRLHSREVLGILIHGDAAFPGQGVVAETLNLSRLTGWDVGGTIHLIANNQLGFTADPHEAFSTSYASGLARGFKVPIVHVNADDAEACIEAARLAWAYRERFALDFLIDLVGYRRYGHNEGDEPAFTQPQLYQKVAQHPTVRQQYAASLVASGQVPSSLPDELVAKHAAVLEKTYAELKPEQDYVPDVPVVPPSGAAAKVRTAVPLERLTALNTALATLPPGFTIHKKLERGRERRGTHARRPRRARGGLGGRRGTGAGLDPRRRHPGALHRRRRRARHLQPPPRGAARRGHRRSPPAAAGAAAGPGGVRDPQQRAVRTGGARLRAGLQPAGAGAGWCCGKRSTATSSTAPRPSSTST